MHEKKRLASNASATKGAIKEQNFINDNSTSEQETSNSNNNESPRACAGDETKQDLTAQKTANVTPPIIQLTAPTPVAEEACDDVVDANGDADVKAEANVVAARKTDAGLAQAPKAEALAAPPPTTSAVSQPKVQLPPHGAPMNYCARRTWITTDRMNELRRKAQEAAKQNKIFTIRGCFSSVRNALITRGWVEKLDMHRKVTPIGQMTYEDLTQRLPKRKAGETRRQYILKCERNIMSRFLEHMPVDFLWTNRKEKCDFIDQAKNPGMTINKFHRAPFTSKEGLCSQLRDFHWFFEEGTAEMYFPRCYNVWSPEELGEFIDNFKLTACVAYLRCVVDRQLQQGNEAVFALSGKIPYSSLDFAYKRCLDYIDSCQHNDIDFEDPPKIWEHDWDAFLFQHQQFVQEDYRIQHDGQRGLECMLKSIGTLLDKIKLYWPQYTLDGYQNLWIVKPANKCRGRGIILMDSLKKILGVVNPSIASKSRYVVQKYIERPLILFQTKFDIRQWFLITNTQPLVVWMYRESYLRFSSQEYSLTNHHESVHLTNYAIQKKYTNGKRDKRLPSENMWDCYSFQAYLRQIGKHNLWLERIYPGMRKAIVGTMLASQENMDRRPNTFELFGADFMICENFYPWLIEINSSPDLGATTSVTARMCPQCLEDVVKVVIDRRIDPKSDLGNFELAYRQVVPPTPAYMGLNLFVKGKQLITKVNHGHNYYYQRKERTLQTSSVFQRQRSALIPTTISRIHRAMPTFNATEYMEKYMIDPPSSGRSNNSAAGLMPPTPSPLNSLSSARQKLSAAPPATGPSAPCPYLLKQAHVLDGRRRSITQLISASAKRNTTGRTDPANSSAGSHATVPPKRQRSCGPRLNSITRESNEKKFKIMIKPFARGSATEPPTQATSSSMSRSENNLLDLYESTTKRLRKPTEVTQPTNGETAIASAPTAPPAAPPVGERKWRSLRNINAKTKSVTATTTTATAATAPGPLPRRFNRTKSEIESTTTLHAIGRNFGRNRSNGRLPVSASALAISTKITNLASNIDSGRLKTASSELIISAAAQIISPRSAGSTAAPLNGTL